MVARFSRSSRMAIRDGWRIRRHRRCVVLSATGPICGRLREELADPDGPRRTNDRSLLYTHSRRTAVCRGGRALTVCQGYRHRDRAGQRRGITVTDGGRRGEGAIARRIFENYQPAQSAYSADPPLEMFKEKKHASNLRRRSIAGRGSRRAYRFLFIARGGGVVSAEPRRFLFAVPRRTCLNEKESRSVCFASR